LRYSNSENQTAWDVIVIGAGPAGSLTAREIARSGRRVLLVDKARFPRPKVCGGCLSGIAVEMLNRLGLRHVLDDAVPLKRVKISAGYRTAELLLPGGVALSREVLDARLVNEAVSAGVEFRPGTLAKLGAEQLDGREVYLNGEAAFARVVIVASGLGGAEGAPETGSRIGAGAMISAGRSGDFFTRGTIYMATGRWGYVGLVRVENDRLDIAAAFDAGFVKRCGGLGPAAQAVLSESSWPIPPGLVDFAWKGTPALTRKPVNIAVRRLFAVGDAAGYIEPFTGEGMAWAVISASLLAPIAVRAVDNWDSRYAQEWESLHRRIIGPRQWRCRLVARVLRSTPLRHISVRVLSMFPFLARPVVASLNSSLHLPEPIYA
jgi:flavin-dependent dehydrogenase